MKKSQKFYHSRITAHKNKIITDHNATEDSSIIGLENPTYITDELSNF